jgi:hypothetical protein
MIDQIRSDIQARLNEVLAEAEKLRGALSALGAQDNSSSTASASAAAPGRRRRATARRSRTSSATAATPQRATRARASSRGGSRTRTASGATKSAVLAALRGGKPMTAGEVASATGLGRASVSTTLSKLSKTGEVNKAARGYTLGKS